MVNHIRLLLSYIFVSPNEWCKISKKQLIFKFEKANKFIINFIIKFIIN